MMDDRLHEVREIKLDDLIPFHLYTTQVYQGERLVQLVDSIEKLGLINPIIVRIIDNGKYEIICGHNRTRAMKELGRDVILADVWEELSDDDAIKMFYDSNLNQQSFSDWNYTQKIKAIQYIETLIKENSQQGKRSDLEEHTDEVVEVGTSVQCRHKSGSNPRRITTRDRMSRRLGIATATLSKYRKIIKLPEELVDVLSRLLDEKMITFEAAYRISDLKPYEVEKLLEYIERFPDKKIDMDKLKALRHKSMDRKDKLIPFLQKDALKEVLIPRNPHADTWTPDRRKPSKH